jgi:shikimate dehydrogenase
MITGKTKVCCLIGNPIEHSISPLIFNKAFEFLNLDFVYLAFRVEEKALNKVIDGIGAFNIRGVNVTIPYKVKVMNFLNKIDRLALEIGAVNTILNENGKLIGLNTDGKGAIRALKENNCKIEGRKVVIIGAGGAGRAVSYFIMKELPEKLVIFNRTKEKAFELADSLKKKFKSNVEAFPLVMHYLKREIENADILINCTSVGMFPNVEATIIPKELLRRDLIVMDIVYNPIETRLLKDVKDVGAKAISGIHMLVYQAALSFKLWTGEEAPIDLMKKIAIQFLRNEKWKGKI